MTSLSTLASALLLSSTIFCRYATISYALLILYNGCFAVLISLASSSIAVANTITNAVHVKYYVDSSNKDVSSTSVLFGVNGFISLLVASVMQAFASGMALTAQKTFLRVHGARHSYH